MRAVLVILLIFGLLAPKMGAAIAAVTPGIDATVICAGGGMRIVHLKDGAPVDVELPGTPDCVVAPLPEAARPWGAWRALPTAPCRAPLLAGAAPPAPARWDGPPPAHGPPEI